MTLADLLPDDDYRFQLRFERGSAAEFFSPTRDSQEILSQRKHWLQNTPSACLALLPEGIPLLEDTIGLACSWKTPPTPTQLSWTEGVTPLKRALDLGESLEPDFILLKPNENGRFCLVAACVCFPSSWSLEQKIGLPLEEIHGVVPGLNEAIGSGIHRFLAKLRPDTAWLRANWGLSRSPELNQHPARKLPRLDETISLDEVWVRIEHQVLAALPKTRGILFGIRIETQPLSEVAADRSRSEHLARALQTMPDAMAQYKGLATSRGRLISLLQNL